MGRGGPARAVELRRARLGAAVALAALVGCGGGSGDDGADLGMEAAIGREFVQQRGCPTCHQPSGAAAGTLSGQTTPLPGTTAYPANLTPDVATGLGGWADIEIVRAMRFGITQQQLPLCPPMPRFDGSDPAQPAMTDVEASAIVAYLRSLPPVAHRVPASMCPPLKPPPPVDMAVPPPPPDDMTMAAHD